MREGFGVLQGDGGPGRGAGRELKPHHSGKFLAIIEDVLVIGIWRGWRAAAGDAEPDL